MGVLTQELQLRTERKGLLGGLKTMGEDFIVNRILDLIGKPDKQNLIKLTRIMESLARREGSIRMARRLRWLFETDHPHLLWWQRLLGDIHFNYRKKFILDIFIRGYFSDSAKRRKELAKQIGFHPPSVMLFSVTQNCNFNCAGCWAHNYDVKEELTYEQWRKVLKEARDEIGIHLFSVVGGEPFIRPDFLDLTEEFSDCAFMTFTNGSLLTDKVIERLQKTGNVYPMLSINGWRETNDAVRGKGSFDMLMEKMDKLRKAGILFGASLTATSKNAEEIASDEFLQMLSDKGAMSTWTFHYVPVGENPDPSLLTTPEQRELLRMATVNARNMLPMFAVDFWADAPMLLGCIAGGKQYFHVNSRGDIEPCAFVHFATHNVKNSTIVEGLKSEFMTAIRNGIPYDNNMLRPCMIVDRAEALREYYEKYKPYETHRGAADYITREDIKEQIDRYAEKVKAVMDKKWEEGLFMTAMPLEGEYYHDRYSLCSAARPAGGVHGGCEKIRKEARGCNCARSSRALKSYIEDLQQEFSR